MCCPEVSFKDAVVGQIHFKCMIHQISDELCFTDQVHKWLTWAYWTSPMMYIQTAISVNEFRSESWKDVISWKLSLMYTFVDSKLHQWCTICRV